MPSAPDSRSHQPLTSSRKRAEPLFKPSEVSVTIEEIALQLGTSECTAYSSVHDILVFHKVGVQTSDWRALSAIATTSAAVFWSGATIKVATSWVTSSLGMKLRFIIMNQKPNGGAYNGNTSLLFQKIQIAPLCQWGLAGSVLGLPRAYPWPLYGLRYHGNKWIISTYWGMNWGRLFAQNGKEVCRRRLFWYVAGYTSPSATFSKWIGKFSNTLPTVQTWTFPISICLPVKNVVRGRQFADDELKEAVHDPLHNQPKSFNHMEKLADCWAQCIKKKKFWNYP